MRDIPGPRVLGVLAGGDILLERLGDWARSADVVLAADGGADRSLAAGVTPTATVGDLDSLVASVEAARAVRDSDQDSSDCDKLLALAQRMGHTHITLIGAEGDRLDHVLGALSSAVRSTLFVRLALRRGLGWVLRGPIDFSIEAGADELVSLMPLEACENVTLTGVRWPLSEARLSAGGLVSLSNRALGGPLTVEIGQGAALLTALSPERETPAWP